MARSSHSTYTAADRYERTMSRRQRACGPTRRQAIADSIAGG